MHESVEVRTRENVRKSLQTKTHRLRNYLLSLTTSTTPLCRKVLFIHRPLWTLRCVRNSHFHYTQTIFSPVEAISHSSHFQTRKQYKFLERSVISLQLTTHTHKLYKHCISSVFTSQRLTHTSSTNTVYHQPSSASDTHTQVIQTLFIISLHQLVTHTHTSSTNTVCHHSPFEQILGKTINVVNVPIVIVLCLLF